MKKMLNNFSLALALFASRALFAYGDIGHLSICHLAYNLISPKTRTEIDKLTKGANFAEQCIWPDLVKRLQPWNYTASYHFINYEDNTVWKPSDLVKLKDKPAFAAPNSGDMIQMGLRAQDMLFKLDSQTQRQQKLCYLRFLSHIAGDTHQPLHAGRGSDYGGNNKKITFDGYKLYPIRNLALLIMRDSSGKIIDDACSRQVFEPTAACVVSQTLKVEQRDNTGKPVLDAAGKPVMTFIENNLHSLWDDGLIEHRARELGILTDANFEQRNLLDFYKSYASSIASEMKPRSQELKKLMHDDILRWVEYANQYRGLSYDLNGIENGKVYYQDRIKVVTDLLQRAAYHLAGSLNEIFDSKSHGQDAKGLEFTGVRRRELNARILAGRTTQFETECDKL